jgi:hypothetical protein
VRNGGAQLTMAQRDAAIAHLEALPGPGADALAALAFLHYAAADDLAARHETERWRDELIATGAPARRALALAPTRADVALMLAEVEFLRGGAGTRVYAPLELSYDTAPRELWVVKRRIGLGLRLVATAPGGLGDRIAGDIRILGEPGRDTDNYRVLARAALLAGPAAIATVRRELGLGHPWPFQIFEQYLIELNAQRQAPPSGRH